MTALKLLQQEGFNMKYASRREVGTATGQRAACPGCNGGLYSRRVALSDDEFIWAHHEANGCEYSYERDFEQYQVGSTSSEVRGRNRNISRLASSIARPRTPIESNEAKLDRLKGEAIYTGRIDEIVVCLLHAITFKAQPSIPGIAGGLKKHLAETDEKDDHISLINSMTSKDFYEAHRGGNLH